MVCAKCIIIPLYCFQAALWTQSTTLLSMRELCTCLKTRAKTFHLKCTVAEKDKRRAGE